MKYSVGLKVILKGKIFVPHLVANAFNKGSICIRNMVEKRGE